MGPLLVAFFVLTWLHKLHVLTRDTVKGVPVSPRVTCQHELITISCPNLLFGCVERRGKSTLFSA